MRNVREPSGNPILEGVIWRQLLVFFFPIMFGTLFQQLYNLADTVVVGRFVGKEALAAVGGSASMIVQLIVGFFVGVTSGAAVVISQYYGAEDEKRLRTTLHTAFAFASAIGVVMGIVGYLGTEHFLTWMHTTDEAMEGSVIYLRIYFTGMLFNMVYNMGASILRAVGDSKRPLYILIVTCLMNIVGDLLLVVGFHMGVAGAAIATVFSQVVSAVLVCVILMRTTAVYRLDLRALQWDHGALSRIVRIGLPAGLESVMYNICNVLVQMFINFLGTDTVAAWGAWGKIDALFWMIINAFAIAITTFVGQNYGAGLWKRMRKSVRVCLMMALGTAVAITVFMMIASPWFYRMFTDDADVIRIGVTMTRFMMPSYGLCVIISILSGALRGTGKVLVPMLLTCGGICLLRIVWLFGVVSAHMTIQMIMLSYPVSWSITAVLFLLYYFREFPGIRKKSWGREL